MLYEMLAGKRAFEGATFSDTVAAVLDREPDWQALPQETPPAALRLLRRCLQKERDKRLHDVADARLELEELLAGPGPGKSSETPSPPRSLAHDCPSLRPSGRFRLVGDQASSIGPQEVMRLSVEVSGQTNPLLTLLCPPQGNALSTTPRRGWSCGSSTSRKAA